MRIFQNAGIYPAYLPRLRGLTKGSGSFSAALDAFLTDRFGACHHLQPISERHESAFFTNGDDRELQSLWARENGLPAGVGLEEILLAQIEAHRTEVFYNLDPLRHGRDFLRRLPGCVKHSVAWRAAPSGEADLGGYDVIVCNFPKILRGYEAKGWRAAYLSPGHDPVTDRFCANEERPIDVVFVGGYSRHHRRRALVLEAVARLAKRYRVVFHLDCSRLTRLAESPLGLLPPLSGHRRPLVIREVAAQPVFGLQLYEELGRARIVLNGAVDMAGSDRGNMRCFETMGCGAVMVSDSGNYPEGMVDGRTMFTYSDVDDAARVIEDVLSSPDGGRAVARQGASLVRKRYDKAAQWQAFQRIVESL
jgi:glycosyltransferase involved in cell wall biosynthesis